MSTFWFDRKPGEMNDGVHADDVSEEFGEGALLIHEGRPDWVRHPTTGVQLPCKAQVVTRMRCPLCKQVVEGVLTYCVTPDGGPIYVLDCPTCEQFVWFEPS